MKYYYTEKQLKDLLEKLVILYDTKEQKNNHILEYFDKHKIKHKERALKTGDYSFMIEACPELGFVKDTYFTDELCIERKNSLTELAGNVAEKDERFFKELNRMINITNNYLLIEDDSLYNLIEHNYGTKYNELSFIRRLLNIQKLTDLYIYFVKKEHMGKMIYEICYSSLMNQILK